MRGAAGLMGFELSSLGEKGKVDRKSISSVREFVNWPGARIERVHGTTAQGEARSSGSWGRGPQG